MSQCSITCRKHLNPLGETMPHTHAHTKAEAVHEALDEYVEAHHHAPEVHDKARIISNAITRWEHEEVELRHAVESPN